MAVRNAFLPLTLPCMQCGWQWQWQGSWSCLVLSGLVSGAKKNKTSHKKSFFASWLSHCNIIGRNDTSLLVLKWKPRVITSFGFWKKIYRSFPFVELNPGPIRGLDVVFVPPIQREIERNRDIGTGDHSRVSNRGWK